MEGRFFYSTDGTDVYGPVTEAELSRLCRVNAIGERSFVCRVGETAWEPFKPDEYRSPAAALAAPAAIPTVVSALPPPSPEPTAAPQTHAAPPGDGDTVAAVVLNIASGVAVLGAAAIVALLRRPPLPDVAGALGYRFGSFAGAVILPVLLGWLLSLFARGMARALIRSIVIFLFAALMTIVALEQSVPHPPVPPPEAVSLPPPLPLAPKPQVAPLPDAGAADAQADANLQKLKSGLTDESESSRIGRDVLSVTTDLLAKVKASDAIEDTCKFTLETVKTPEDLDAQMAAITRLRAAQGDVVTFLQNYDQHCRDVLTRDGIAAGTQAEVIAGARKGAHVDLLIGLWQAKMKLSDDHIARFAFLRKNWGQWELTEGKVFFRDDAALAGYCQLAGALQDDVQKVRDIQGQIFH